MYESLNRLITLQHAEICLAFIRVFRPYIQHIDDLTRLDPDQQNNSDLYCIYEIPVEQLDQESSP